MGVHVERVAVERIIDLRHAVLRAGLPRETAFFDGDDATDTRHYAAIEDGRVIGCVTILLNTWQNEPAWQLRGMAVASDYRGQGIGQAMLRAVEQAALDSPHHLIWCNARTPAAAFYQRHGWAIASPEFDIPTAGPHVKMVRRVSGLSA